MVARGLEVMIRSSADRVELARLTTTLSQVRLALSEIDHVYLMRGSRPTWVVDGLQDHPGRLVVRVIPTRGRRRDPESLLAPVEALVSGVESLDSIPEVPHYYTDATVERLVKIGEPGHGVREVSLATVNGGPSRYYPVSEQVRLNARRAVRGTTVSMGSVAGWLDTLSTRRVGKGLIGVGLYDKLTRRAVTGSLPLAMEGEVHRLWGHRVLALGRVTRNDRGQAVRISIERLDQLPETDDDRTPVRDLLGVDPEWIGGQDVDEHVREARRA